MITDDEFETLRQKVLGQLGKKLSVNLTYHSVAHTMDVLEKAVEIAKQEGVNNENEIMLLKVAALFHDTGFLEVYMGHEEKSCFIMRDEVKVEWWYLTILVLESIPDETRHLVYETNCC